jgi:predicted MFS family arabinose efflux permease
LPQSFAYPPAFLRLAWSNLAAQSAEQIALAAASLVAVLALGAGTGGTGLLQAAQTLPFLLLSVPAGLLADRTASRPRLLAAAEAMRAASLILILILAGFGVLSLPLLALLGFVGAAGTVAYSVATPALVPSLVRREALPTANGRIELARTTAFAAGPALGGTLVGWVGSSFAFGAAAGLSILAVALLSGVREPVRPKPPRRHPLTEVREGASFVFRHPLLRPVFATQIAFSLAFFVLQAAYVPYAVHHLGLGAFGVGLTLAFYGGGLVVGALSAARIVAALPFGVVVGIGPLSGLAASLLMALTILVPWAWLAGLAFFIMGAGPVVWLVSTTTLRQTVTPAVLLGRVSALNILTYGARPVGAALAALVGEAYGSEACLLLAVSGFLVQAMVIFASPVPRLARLPEGLA